MSRKSNLIIVLFVVLAGLFACTGSDCEIEDNHFGLGGLVRGGGYYSQPVYNYYPPPPPVYYYEPVYVDPCAYGCGGYW